MKLDLPEGFPPDLDVAVVAGMVDERLVVGLHGPPDNPGVFGIWLADILHHYLLDLGLKPGSKEHAKAKWEAHDIFTRECRIPTDEHVQSYHPIEPDADEDEDQS